MQMRAAPNVDDETIPARGWIVKFYYRLMRPQVPRAIHGRTEEGSQVQWLYS